MCVALCVSYALHLLLLGCCYAVHINAIVNVMKVYIERATMQDELIRFRKKYRHYSRLLLRSVAFNATDMFTPGKSLQHKPVQ